MRRFTSQFIIGILMLTGLCTSVMETNAQNMSSPMMSHDMEGGLENCCDVNDQGIDLITQRFSEDHEFKVKTWLAHPQKNIRHLASLPKNLSIRERPPDKEVGQHLRTVILLE